MIEKDYQYFPSLNEIKNGLMEGQMNKFMNEQWNDRVPANYIYEMCKVTWDNIFQVSTLKNPDKPLRANTLSDLNSPVTRHLIYIYSMESPIYKELNNTSRY